MLERASGWQLTLAAAFALVMLASAALIVIDATAGASPVVPASPYTAGWLRSLAGEQLSYRVFLGCLLAFTAAYAGLLPLARRLPTRAVIGFLAVLYVAVLVGPVVGSADVFSYIAYARMDVIHGLNPYTSVPFAMRHDPVYPFVGADWIFAPSEYGPLYTLLTFPFALAGVVGALWGMKVAALLACVGIDWLVWRCAVQRRVDARFALLTVGANPLLVIYSLASAQLNDFLMIALTMLGIYLASAAHIKGTNRRAGLTRDAGAAAAVVVAALVKVPAMLMLPFMVVGRRRFSTVVGAVIASAAGLAAVYAAFGGPGIDLLASVNRAAGYVSGDSFATQFAHLLGKPGVFPVDHTILKGALLLFGLYLLLRTWRGYDWVAASGWALLAAAVGSTWLQPWYLLWPLPLAVISRDRRLLWATLLVQALFVIHQLPPMFTPQ